MAEKKELAVTEELVVEIEMERLRSFENHPFKVKADSQMNELQESEFQDINYQLAQQEDKTEIFEEWCSFHNFLTVP